jgi:DNA modification methylase
MIVWDKQAIGLGFGWRPQHELIMFSHKTKAKWDIHKGYGNVLTCKRTFNPLHPTQKPVELIEQILGNTSWASGVYDSFAGSGSILIACDTHGQSCYAMEVEPKYCDVIVRRYKSWRENNNRSANITQFRDGAILQNIGS